MHPGGCQFGSPIRRSSQEASSWRARAVTKRYNGLPMTPWHGFLYGLVAGGAGIAVISAARVSAGRFPWEVPGRSTVAGAWMYVVQVVLYFALGGFAGWMTVSINVMATVIFAGLAGPPALMKYVSEVRGERGDDGGG